MLGEKSARSEMKLSFSVEFKYISLNILYYFYSFIFKSVMTFAYLAFASYTLRIVQWFFIFFNLNGISHKQHVKLTLQPHSQLQDRPSLGLKHQIVLH